MPLTVTTWNIQNFATSSTLFPTKLALLSDSIQALGADIVALQEVLDEEALAALADALGFHAVAGTPDGRGNRVAFLTRDPIATDAVKVIAAWRLPEGETVRRHDDRGRIVIDASMPRPALQISVQHQGRDLDLINVHLKSKLLSFPRGRFSTSDESLRARTAYFALARRSAEAITLREVASERLSEGRDLIVLGDFNDGPLAATTDILYGPPGSQPQGPEEAGARSGSFQRPDQGDAQRLFNVTYFVPQAQRWSRRHNGQPELLDHILISAGLMPPDPGGLRRVPTVSIRNADLPNLVGTDPEQGEALPDHAPVTAVFA